MKEYLPLPARHAIARLRNLKHPADVLGRFAIGGLHAYIATSVRAPLWRHISVGKDAQIHRGTLLHTNDMGVERRIVIGARSFVGQHCFFSAGDLIELEQDCLVGAACSLLGAGHATDDPTRPYAASPIVSYGEIVFEANCWIGTACTIVGGVRVGFGSIIAAGSLLRHSVPPLCMVAGHPARVTKVFDWERRQWLGVPAGSQALQESLLAREAAMPTRVQFLEALGTAGGKVSQPVGG